MSYKEYKLLIWGSVTIYVCFVVITILHGSGYLRCREEKTADVQKPDTNTVLIKYRSNMEMIYEKDTKRLILRISTNSASPFEHLDAIHTIKKEIIKLTRNRAEIAFGNGYRFHYSGGYPIWAPYQTLYSGEGKYSCIFFAENVEMAGKNIYASGTVSKTPFYGYDDPEI